MLSRSEAMPTDYKIDSAESTATDLYLSPKVHAMQIQTKVVNPAAVEMLSETGTRHITVPWSGPLNNRSWIAAQLDYRLIVQTTDVSIPFRFPYILREVLY